MARTSSDAEDEVPRSQASATAVDNGPAADGQAVASADGKEDAEEFRDPFPQSFKDWLRRAILAKSVAQTFPSEKVLWDLQKLTENLCANVVQDQELKAVLDDASTPSMICDKGKNPCVEEFKQIGTMMLVQSMLNDMMQHYVDNTHVFSATDTQMIGKILYNIKHHLQRYAETIAACANDIDDFSWKVTSVLGQRSGQEKVALDLAAEREKIVALEREKKEAQAQIQSLQTELQKSKEDHQKAKEAIQSLQQELVEKPVEREPMNEDDMKENLLNFSNSMNEAMWKNAPQKSKKNIEFLFSMQDFDGDNDFNSQSEFFAYYVQQWVKSKRQCVEKAPAAGGGNGGAAGGSNGSAPRPA